MRTSPVICILVAACSAGAPATEAPVIASTPEAAPSVKLDAPASDAKVAATTLTPAPQPPAQPSDPKKRIPLAAAPPRPVVTVPGGPAPELALGETELLAVQRACKELCSTPPCTCDATRPLPHYLLFHALSRDGSASIHDWYVLQKIATGWVTLMVTEDHPGGETTQYPDNVCGARAEGPLPGDLGVVNVRLPDLNMDGRPDLLFECQYSYGAVDLRYCLSDKQYCVQIPLREVREGEVMLDLDVDFRDGWFIRKVRTDVRGEAQGNVSVDWVNTPDPSKSR